MADHASQLLPILEIQLPRLVPGRISSRIAPEAALIRCEFKGLPHTRPGKNLHLSILAQTVPI